MPRPAEPAPARPARPTPPARPAVPAPGPGTTPAVPRPRERLAAHNQALGRRGEDLAAHHLVGLGMVLLDRNWRCPAGEIDLVLREGSVLVVCEVKTRTTAAFGMPLEAVDRRKLERLRRLGAAWLRAHDVRVRDVRIDVVGVLAPTRGPVEVEHVAGVL